MQLNSNPMSKTGSALLKTGEKSFFYVEKRPKQVKKGVFERVPASKWRLFSIFFFFERNNDMISDTVMDRHF